MREGRGSFGLSYPIILVLLIRPSMLGYGTQRQNANISLDGKDLTGPYQGLKV